MFCKACAKLTIKTCPQITMSDLELLPHMYAPLQLMFAEHCVELELKAAHRQRVRERRASTPSIPPGKRSRNDSSASSESDEVPKRSRNLSNENNKPNVGSREESNLPGLSKSKGSLKSSEKVSPVHARKFSTECVITDDSKDCMEQDSSNTRTDDAS